jgi:hypothetical protein
MAPSSRALTQSSAPETKPLFNQPRFIAQAMRSVAGSAAMSWRNAKISQASLDFPHLANNPVTIGSQLPWQGFRQGRSCRLGVNTLESGVRGFRVGLRLPTSSITLVRLDTRRRKEGWRFLLKLTDRLRLRRLTKDTAALSLVT